MRVFESTPTLVVYGETGRFPLQLRKDNSTLNRNIMPTTRELLHNIYKHILLFHNEDHDTERVKACKTLPMEIVNIQTPGRWITFCKKFTKLGMSHANVNW